MCKLMIFMASLMLFGCASVKQTDEYTFQKPSFTHTDIQLKVIMVNNQAELENRLNHYKHGDILANVKLGNQVFAFSVLSKDNSTCTIVMIDPQVKYRPEFIGHELVHCIYGDWHHDQP